MMKTTKQENNCVIYLIMFYENRKSIIFKALGVVDYGLIKKYVCVDYLSLQREPKLLSSHRGFEYTLFDKISGIGIPEMLLNFFSCYGFVLKYNSTLLLACRSKLVSYYLSKGLWYLNNLLKTWIMCPGDSKTAYTLFICLTVIIQWA